jgi:hypothetical protein
MSKHKTIKTPVPPPPSMRAEADAGLEPTQAPALDFDALRDRVVALDDESKRDMLQAIMDTMAVSDDHSEEDAADVVKDTRDSWRGAEPEVYAVGIVARVIGRTLDVANVRADLLEYIAGRTPAQQSKIKARLRVALGTAVDAANQAAAQL